MLEEGGVDTSMLHSATVLGEAFHPRGLTA